MYFGIIKISLWALNRGKYNLCKAVLIDLLIHFVCKIKCISVPDEFMHTVNRCFFSLLKDRLSQRHKSRTVKVHGKYYITLYHNGTSDNSNLRGQNS